MGKVWQKSRSIGGRNSPLRRPCLILLPLCPLLTYYLEGFPVSLPQPWCSAQFTVPSASLINSPPYFFWTLPLATPNTLLSPQLTPMPYSALRPPLLLSWAWIPSAPLALLSASLTLFLPVPSFLSEFYSLLGLLSVSPAKSSVCSHKFHSFFNISLIVLGTNFSQLPFTSPCLW